MYRFPPIDKYWQVKFFDNLENIITEDKFEHIPIDMI